MRLSTMRLLFLLVLTSMALVSCYSRGVSPTAQQDSEIIGVVWRLREIQRTNGQTVLVDELDKYTLELLPNGQVRIRADCNRGFGSYTMRGRKISFHKTAYTRAACPPGSLFDEFTRKLHEANSYVVKDGNLYITYGINAGIMKFSK